MAARYRYSTLPHIVPFRARRVKLAPSGYVPYNHAPVSVPSRFDAQGDPVQNWDPYDGYVKPKRRWES